MKKLTAIILSAILFAGCSKDTDRETFIQGEPIQSVQTPQITRVFNGSFSSTINTDPGITPMQCTGDLPGLFLPDHFLHGNAIHMGQLIWEQSTLRHLSCNLSFSTRQLTASVSGQISAANGDVIYYNGNDVIDVTNLLTSQGITGSIQGVWNITGGTGRFEEASGSFSINGLVDFTTGTFSVVANGTITY